MGEHIYTCDCVRMGKRCVVANCNSTHKNRVSLFTFPKNAKLRATWNRQIKSTRADWHSPEYLCVCSKHFTEDCFESQSVVSGIAFSLMFGCDFIINECFRATLLKPGAVPTIFPKPASSSDTSIRPRRRSAAFQKRAFQGMHIL